jgi:hypothetical protein
MMKITASVFLLAIASSSRAFAADSGFELGARIGVGLPMGDSTKGAALSDGVGLQLPIVVDLGYRFSPAFSAGVYGGYGFVTLASDTSDLCDAAGVDCSASNARIGVQAQYHFSPEASMDPWIGAGFGLEWLTLSLDEQENSFSGFEFLHLQGGLTWTIGDALELGPFLDLALGQYSTASSDDQDVDIEETALHQWVFLGLQGVFGPI